MPAERGLRGLVERHPLGAFIALAYVFSWAYWLPLALTDGEMSHFPGLLGPMLAAFVVSAVVEGRSGVRSLLSRMVHWRVPTRWYLAALVPAATGLLGVAAVALTQGEWPSFDELSTMPGLPTAGFLALFLIVFVINGYGEEVGWRGFAWPRFRERHCMAAAAGLLGVAWAGWHLPVFWIDSGMRDLDRIVIPGWVIGLMAGSLVLGWLYERADSSLLIVALFHTCLNLASATRATEGLPAALTSVVVIVWAVSILWWRRRGRPTSRAEASAGRFSSNPNVSSAKDRLH